MSQLFCKVGDLAVTVEAEVMANIGNVVKIVRAVGYEGFSSYQKIFLWEVEAASSERLLVYEYPDGKIDTCGDPAMGTGGFLITYLQYILQLNDTTVEKVFSDNPHKHIFFIN